MGWERAIFNWLGAGRYNATPPTLAPGALGDTTALQCCASANVASGSLDLT